MIDISKPCSSHTIAIFDSNGTIFFTLIVSNKSLLMRQQSIESETYNRHLGFDPQLTQENSLFVDFTIKSVTNTVPSSVKSYRPSNNKSENNFFENVQTCKCFIFLWCLVINRIFLKVIYRISITRWLSKLLYFFFYKSTYIELE